MNLKIPRLALPAPILTFFNTLCLFVCSLPTPPNIFFNVAAPLLDNVIIFVVFVTKPVGGSLTRSLVTRLTNAYSSRAACINGLCMLLMLPVLWVIEETPR